MIDPTLMSRGLGAYLGLAVGDALGATVEFMTPREILHRHGVHRDVVGGGWLRLVPGQVTDDTEMALALGDAILRKGRVEANSVAEAFSNWMRGKPVDIGHTVRRGIAYYRRSGQATVAADDENAGNGACMRCLPVALRYCRSPEFDWIDASRQQAHVTHNSPVADSGAETVLRILIDALNGADRDHVTGHAHCLAARQPLYRFDRRRVENPSGWLVETLQAVFQALSENGDFESMLVDVVNRGGDADTTGAIMGMIAGALYGVDAIPDRWLNAVDKRVDAACRQQTKGLLTLALSRNAPETGGRCAGV